MACTVVTHMVDNKDNDVWLPCGGFVNKKLEYHDFNFESEETNLKYIGIGIGTLNQIGTINEAGVLSYKIVIKSNESTSSEPTFAQ